MDTKVSSRGWLFINVVLIVFAVAITGSIAFQVSIVESSKRKLFGTFGLAVLIVYLTEFICSSVFVVLTCALRSLVDEKGGNFIYPMMHRFILYYQASERT